MSRSLDKKRLAVSLHRTGDLRSSTDSGYLSWRIFTNELHDCTNKIVRGRDLTEFVEQSDQVMNTND